MVTPVLRALSLGRARAALVVAVALGLIGLALLRPLSATPGQTPPAAPTAPPAQEEENGGEIVFKVTHKIQKLSVVYSHEKHLAKGIQCEECHEKTFEKKLNANKFKMADINRGKYCGICHTDTPAADIKHAAFAPKKNCERCHTVKVHDSSEK